MNQLLRKRVSNAIYQELKVPREASDGSYAELVTACRFLEAATDAGDIRRISLGILERFIPRGLRRLTRLAVHNDRVSGWIAALVVPSALKWLIGVGTPHISRSSAVIHRCRLLAATASPRLCYQFCKGPSQEFFTDSLNIPLHMKPNLEDCSCSMSFGPRARKLIELESQEVSQKVSD